MQITQYLPPLMLFFGNKKGKTIPLSNLEKPCKNQGYQADKSSTPIELTIDANKFKSLSTDLENNYKELATIIQSSNQRASTINKAKKHMVVEIKMMGKEKQQLLNSLVQQADEIFNEEESNQSIEQVENYYAEINNQFKEELESLINQLNEVSVQEARNTHSYLFYKNLDSELDQQNCILDKKICRLKSEVKEKQKMMVQLKDSESKLEEQSRILFEDKRKANNLLQQFKGNVRVYCRLRPCESSSEPLDYEVNQNLIKIKKNKKDLKSNNSLSQWDYLFDRVFDTDTTQQSLFNQLSELVQCSFDGKNVCIFAYGQTGSGKTFTMNGSLDKETRNLRGFVPRSIEYIFDQVHNVQTKGYKTKIYISVSQIYKDKQRDLININKNQNKNEKKSKNHPGNSKTATGGYLQHGQFQYSEVKNADDAIFVLKETLKGRTTANTLMNEQSSRSHLVIEIKYEIEHQEKKKKRTSSLVLIDLAGSQRRKDAGESVERQQEGASINNSLTNLGNVIRAIKQGQMAPFRSNVLTMALQRNLEGDSKVVMFVNVSTENSNLEQTINSLNFADQARSCQIKKEKKRHESLDHR